MNDDMQQSDLNVEEHEWLAERRRNIAGRTSPVFV
jgi:hypothetical protein